MDRQTDKTRQDSRSNLPLNQPPKKIKTITIALQLHHPPRRSILPAQLLRHQQAPVARDALDPRLDTALRFQRDDLIHVQPAVVVHILKSGVEADGGEAGVEGGEGGEDGSEEFFEGEGG